MVSDAVALDLQIEVLRLSRESLRETAPIAWARATVELASLLVQRGDVRQKSESLEEAIEACRQALEAIPRDEEPDLWGRCQSLLAIALSDRLTGIRDDNLDAAIEACRSALEVFPRETDPDNWASIMNIRGTAFANRTRGGPSQNQEEALSAFEAALQVWTRSVDPRQWAYLQNNLAVLYRDRIEGDPHDNLERAIAAGTGALEVLDPEEDFVEWVMTTNNLASAWRFRIEGEPGENLDMAIRLYEDIAGGLDPKEEPELWADTWHNVAAAWWDQGRGNRSENLDMAISAGERSLAARPKETAPVAWARTALLLSGAYAERTRDDLTENLERALDLAHRGLEIITFETLPFEWAASMVNMAAIYLQRERTRRDVNAEAALKACEQALIVIHQNILPLEWARTLNILGVAYQMRTRDDPAENLEKSIEAFRQALAVVPEENRLYPSLLQNLANSLIERRVGPRRKNLRLAIELLSRILKLHPRELSPYGWARTQHALGNAWARLASTARSRGFREALAAYQEALTIRTIDAFPNEYRITQRRLGHLYFAVRRWREAQEAYAASFEALQEVFRTSATPDARQTDLFRSRDVGPCAAYCSARLRMRESAVELLERTRARALSEALGRSETLLRLARKKERAAWTTMMSRIDRLEAAARSAGPTDPRPFLAVSSDLREARREQAKLIERIRRATPDAIPRPWELADIRSTAEAVGHPLVYLAATRHGTLALPVLPGGSDSCSDAVIWLDGFTTDHLDPLLEERGGYVEASLSGDPQQLESALDRDWPVWKERLMGPLDRWLSARGFREGVLIPCGALGLLPLHAASETVLWAVIPSARVLRAGTPGLRARQERPEAFLGIGNPLPSHPPLPCGEIEIDEAGALFSEERRLLLRGPAATRDAVMSGMAVATHVHFACHGRFNPWDALSSFLNLAAGEKLTLRNILDGSLDLSSVRLVVLSACEAGFIEYQRTPDEVLSLPAALLQAGVTGVISSLWSVGDLATALFVRELYRAHLSEGLEPAQALHQARTRLREETAAGLGVAALCEDWLERSGGRDHNAYRALRHHRAHPDAVPFRHPRHWAGFVLNGV